MEEGSCESGQLPETTPPPLEVILFTTDPNYLCSPQSIVTELRQASIVRRDGWPSVPSSLFVPMARFLSAEHEQGKQHARAMQVDEVEIGPGDPKGIKAEAISRADDPEWSSTAATEQVDVDAAGRSRRDCPSVNPALFVARSILEPTRRDEANLQDGRDQLSAERPDEVMQPKPPASSQTPTLDFSPSPTIPCSGPLMGTGQAHTLPSADQAHHSLGRTHFPSVPPILFVHDHATSPAANRDQTTVSFGSRLLASVPPILRVYDHVAPSILAPLKQTDPPIGRSRLPSVQPSLFTHVHHVTTCLAASAEPQHPQGVQQNAKQAFHRALEPTLGKELSKGKAEGYEMPAATSEGRKDEHGLLGPIMDARDGMRDGLSSVPQSLRLWTHPLSVCGVRLTADVARQKRHGVDEEVWGVGIANGQGDADVAEGDHCMIGVIHVPTKEPSCNGIFASASPCMEPKDDTMHCHPDKPMEVDKSVTSDSATKAKRAHSPMSGISPSDTQDRRQGAEADRCGAVINAASKLEQVEPYHFASGEQTLASGDFGRNAFPSVGQSLRFEQRSDVRRDAGEAFASVLAKERIELASTDFGQDQYRNKLEQARIDPHGKRPGDLERSQEDDKAQAPLPFGPLNLETATLDAPFRQKSDNTAEQHSVLHNPSSTPPLAVEGTQAEIKLDDAADRSAGHAGLAEPPNMVQTSYARSRTDLASVAPALQIITPEVSLLESSSRSSAGALGALQPQIARYKEGCDPAQSSGASALIDVPWDILRDTAGSLEGESLCSNKKARFDQPGMPDRPDASGLRSQLAEQSVGSAPSDRHGPGQKAIDKLLSNPEHHQDPLALPENLSSVAATSASQSNASRPSTRSARERSSSPSSPDFDTLEPSKKRKIVHWSEFVQMKSVNSVLSRTLLRSAPSLSTPTSKPTTSAMPSTPRKAKIAEFKPPTRMKPSSRPAPVSVDNSCVCKARPKAWSSQTKLPPARSSSPVEPDSPTLSPTPAKRSAESALLSADARAVKKLKTPFKPPASVPMKKQHPDSARRVSAYRRDSEGPGPSRASISPVNSPVGASSSRLMTSRLAKSCRKPGISLPVRTGQEHGVVLEHQDSPTQSRAMEIAGLERDLQTLRQAAKFLESPEEDDKLRQLIGQWRDAGRDIVERLFEKVPEPDQTAESADRTGYSSYESVGHGAQSAVSAQIEAALRMQAGAAIPVDEEGNMLDHNGSPLDLPEIQLPISETPKRRELNEDEELDSMLADMHRDRDEWDTSSGSSTQQATRAQQAFEKEPWNYGSLMRTLQVDPDLFGYDEEEMDWTPM